MFWTSVVQVVEEPATLLSRCSTSHFGGAKYLRDNYKAFYTKTPMKFHSDGENCQYCKYLQINKHQTKTERDYETFDNILENISS
jgi:hypothetical protein